MARPPLARMMQLHQLLAAGKYPNCRTLGEKLEVSSKTIQRDIEFMRDRMDYPIEYDPLRFGFFYTEPVSAFPRIELAEGELVALLIAQRALAAQRGTSLDGPLQSACRKIAEGMQGKISVDLAELDAAISFRSAGGSEVSSAVFEAVSRAVLQREEISFHYHKLGSDQLELRRTRPYHLGCVEQQWYCFGYCLDREQVRTFALTRMRKVKSAGVKFAVPADFSIARYLHASFGVFSSEEGKSPQRVRIRFDAWAARLIRERLWHESQTLISRPKGEVELHLELGSLHEIERWILSWGEHAHVLAPKALHNRIRAIGRAVAAG